MAEPKGYIPGIDGPNEEVDRADGSKMRKKATKVQKLMRVQQVVSWMLDGLSYTEVMKRGMRKWGLSTRSVERYIESAREQVETMAATEIRGATTLALQRLSDLYFQAVDSGDFKTALDIIKTQNRMLGLNAPDKIEARTVQDWNTMTVTEQLQKVQGILERATDAERQVN